MGVERLSAAAPERSSRRVPESIRVRADASGTSFTKTANFTGADPIGLRVSRRRRVFTRSCRGLC